MGRRSPAAARPLRFELAVNGINVSVAIDHWAALGELLAPDYVEGVMTPTFTAYFPALSMAVG